MLIHLKLIASSKLLLLLPAPITEDAARADPAFGLRGSLVDGWVDTAVMVAPIALATG